MRSSWQMKRSGLGWVVFNARGPERHDFKLEDFDKAWQYRQDKITQVIKSSRENKQINYERN